uniref:Vesicle transport v-SNARE N-terminal domain-containing protein n=1 Tax=Coccolithus braarudii TaxID=221442 RepID=A0A7S0Q0X2_9EUKA|mmetsp:Transcript_21400/g.45993  ORF Transcript_21400/g.45993 Transcript_21400/m.45993 type:complete len:236 (+) Transcript_21400:106-813(+)
MAVLAAYEKELAAVLCSARSRISGLRDETGTVRAASISEAEAELASVRELLDQMALEVSSASRSERAPLQARLQALKTESSSLTRDLKQAMLIGPKGDGSPPPELTSEATEQRARLLATTERERASTAKLREAHKTLQETEGIGASILSDLKSQRETLMHSVGTLRGANEALSRSKRVISAIGRRALANKIIMWFMILLISCGIFFVLYLQFFGGLTLSAAGQDAPAAPALPPSA